MRWFKGEVLSGELISNDSTFAVTTSVEWKNCLHKIDKVMEEWIQSLSESIEDKFDQPVHEGSEMNWWELLANTTIHNAYHIGQILIIRKLQGSWNHMVLTNKLKIRKDYYNETT